MVNNRCRPVFAAGRIAKPIVGRLNRKVTKLLKSTGMRDRLAIRGARPAPTRPEVFTRIAADEIRFGCKVARDASMRPD